jgi:hypothetical protein
LPKEKQQNPIKYISSKIHTVISIFLHLNIKYSGTISIRDEQQFVPLVFTNGELGDDEFIFK